MAIVCLLRCRAETQTSSRSCMALGDLAAGKGSSLCGSVLPSSSLQHPLSLVTISLLTELKLHKVKPCASLGMTLLPLVSWHGPCVRVKLLRGDCWVSTLIAG